MEYNSRYCDDQIIYYSFQRSLMNKLLPFLVFIVFSGFAHQAQKKRIVFYGDSITHAGVDSGGYIDRMNQNIKQQGLADADELIGAGSGGNKVYELYLRMEDDVLAKKPDVVVIWVGVNDVRHKRTSGTGTDPDKF